jgi:hypothetical protein
VRQAHDKHWPGVLYLGPSTLGAWSTPPREQIVRAAARHVDVLRISTDHQAPDYAERLDFFVRHGGDKPWTASVGMTANPDSGLAGDSRALCKDTVAATQEERGRLYYDRVLSFFQPASDGVIHIAGLNFWSLLDNHAECANWGLISHRDNAYDGKEAIRAWGTDPWGFPAGGERADYGDFLSRVTQANRIWLDRISRSSNTRRRR